MRLSIASKPHWLLADDGELLGLCAGFDFCAEHEWGIEGIWKAFGLNAEADGVARRRVRTRPNTLTEVVQSDTRAIFLVRGHEAHYKQATGWLEDWLYCKQDGLVCGWDADSFGFAAHDREGCMRMSALFKAFVSKDVAIWPGGRGLTFRILSKISDEERKQVLDADLDKKALKVAADATGIEAELRAAGKRWYALQPGWASKERRSAFPVSFFLNPQDQHLYNFGWFTVEDLKLWAKDTGPVMQGTGRPEPKRRRSK